MSDLFLPLIDKARVVDFLVENLECVDAKDRKAAEESIRAYQEGEKVHTDALAEIARKLAIASWPARDAMRRFFAEKGREEEWKRVVAAVRPSTAHLLERFRKGTETSSLDETLEHADADLALRDAERTEIDEVRKQLRHDFWREKKTSLRKLQIESASELKNYLDRFRRLRDLAIDLPHVLQDEVFSKLKHYEDRVLFAGERVACEILDEEIKYYIEQKEMSPFVD